jgi:hypothetical protein
LAAISALAASSTTLLAVELDLRAFAFLVLLASSESVVALTACSVALTMASFILVALADSILAVALRALFSAFFPAHPQAGSSSPDETASLSDESESAFLAALVLDLT